MVAQGRSPSKEPDRVPLDLGGTVDSTIMAVAYGRLREHLALVENDVRRALGIDVLLAGYEPTRWRGGMLPDGPPAEFPTTFLPQQQEDGSQVIFDEQGNVVLRMPEGGHYFDTVYSPLADATSVRDIDEHMEAIERYDRPSHLDKQYEDLAEKAKALREETDYLLVGFFGAHTFQAGQSLRGWETFLPDLLENPVFRGGTDGSLGRGNNASL